ncbi:hypothetical protein [Rugamonas sp. DEMB1]|jgi:hypothetical protein|uniref:hypothetical protein n=1 Tax=Rugamonas sp. DEMB1 TaxID=3039386 RepID=UPI002447FAB3|nr:hypothetical protein [Rugamonas sp. DEMB1]WGG53036.1 hypothetical protein QC826_13510 [Rugamonas sp. DEMB1]
MAALWAEGTPAGEHRYENGRGGQLDPNTYISVTAVNLGDRATTITNLGFLYFDSWFGVMFRRNRPAKTFIITSPSPAQALPFRFEAGAQWIGMALQGADVVEMIRNGHLFVVLYHSHGGSGVRFRLKSKELTA